MINLSNIFKRRYFYLRRCFSEIFQKSRVVFLMPVILVLVFNFSLVLAQAESEEVLPNEMGLVPILEYHRIGLSEGNFRRSVENFKKDLQWLYNNDYVLIPMRDFIHQEISIPYGKKPVIFTFDDSTQSQFNYLEDGTIDPNSAIGLLDEFFEDHPDFGRSAIFYANGTLFEQKNLIGKKLKYLISTGREIGNHTLSHAYLSKLPASQIEAELGGLADKTNSFSDQEVIVESIAFPFGLVPKGDNLKSVEKGNFNGWEYVNRIGLLVGADPSHAVYSKKFNAMYVPRIQADDTEWKRWFGRSSGAVEKQLNSEVFTAFVSDGLENVVSVPLGRWSEMMDESLIREGVFVCVYEDISECEEKWEKGKGESQVENLEVNEQSGGFDLSLLMGNILGIAGEVEKSEEIIDEESEENSVAEEDVKELEDFDDKDLSVIKVSSATPDLYPGIDNLNLLDNADLDVLSEFVKNQLNQVVSVSKSLLPKFEIRDLPDELILEGGKYFYDVRDGDNLTKVSEKFLKVTKYYLAAEFKEAFLDLNLNDFKSGDKVEIPGVEKIVWDIAPNPAYKKGIYWTGYTASSREGMNQLETFLKNGGNTVVFDIKEIEGHLYFDTQNVLAKDLDLARPLIADLPKLVRTLHRRGVYVVARQVVFKDLRLAKSKSEWAPRHKITGAPWSNREGVVWMDPSHPEVQNYNIAIAKEIANSGVDEIQFDYIRFPALGDVKNSTYYYQYKENRDVGREDIIVEYLEKVHEAVKGTGVKLSADIFGIVAWSNGYDAGIVGQDIAKMGKYLDAIYPMAYPSHFGAGYAGHANPGGEPYFFVYESVKKFMELAKGTNTEIRPWIQGFSWGATGFGTEYVYTQIKAGEDLNAGGYVIWSAGNKYDVSWGAIKRSGE